MPQNLLKIPEVHTKTKYIKIQHHFIIEKTTSNEIYTVQNSTKEHKIDILTKPLEKN